MGGTVRISRQTIVDAMQSQGVRDALREKADKIAARAEALAATSDSLENVKIWVEDGTRPKGRPYSAVKCDDAEQEYGSFHVSKTRLLGRAAGLAGD